LNCLVTYDDEFPEECCVDKGNTDYDEEINNSEARRYEQSKRVAEGG
jgi:hypothetical protein